MRGFGSRARLASLCCVAALFVLLGCSRSSIVESGPTGWESTQWGMTSEELQDQLGSVVHELPARENFGPMYYSDLVADPYQMCGERFRVYLQMGGGGKGLSRIFMEAADTIAVRPRQALVSDVEGFLTAAHGSPVEIESVAEDDLVNIQREWQCDTYVIHLDYLFIGMLESSDLLIAYEPR